MSYFREYPYITENLQPSYDGFLYKLKEIIKTTDQLFVTQIHPDYGVYDQVFRDWFNKNPGYKPQPFTVSRIEKGEYVEIPYHLFYKDAVKKICDLLEEAKELVSNIDDGAFDKKWWRKYMSVLQTAYQSDVWEDAEKYFLSLPKDSPLLLSIGAIEPYHDKLTGIKRFYCAWLLVRNTKEQAKTDNVLEHINGYLKKINDSTNGVTFFIGDLLFAGGEVAKHGTMGWSRPEKVALAEEYGSIKMIALNRVSQNNKRITAGIEKSLQMWKLSPELKDAVMQFNETHPLLPLVLHEYSHTYRKNPNAHKNLQSYYTDIEETRANTYMAYFAHILETQNQIPKHTTQNIILRALLYLTYLYEEYTLRNQREAYYFAGLYWLKKAEQLEIVTIDDTITVNQTVFEKKLESFIEDAQVSLEILVGQDNSQAALEKQKKELFLFGADLARKLGW